MNDIDFIMYGARADFILEAEMNEERDFFYRTLGLQPGASLSEVEAAYRRLAELYQPDRDPSLDAEVKYREIRAAYKALLDGNISGETDSDVKSVVSSGVFPRRTTELSGGGMPKYNPSGTEVPFKKMLTIKLFLAISGGIPLLAIENSGYVILGIVLILIAYFSSFNLERYAIVDDNTASRMSFWFSFAISAGLYLFANSRPLIYYFFLLILCTLGLLMPGNFLMKDPRFPSQW